MVPTCHLNHFFLGLFNVNYYFWSDFHVIGICWCINHIRLPAVA